MGERLGYARVSTIEQNAARQQSALLDAGVQRVWLDRASGKNLDARPELAQMLDYARDGDELVVTSLDRLARSLPDLLALVETLTTKGVTVRVLDPALVFTGSSDDPVGRLMLGLLGAVADFERSLLLQRQREGIAQARKRKAYKGRQPIAPERIEQARALVAGGVPVAEAARRIGVSRSVLVRAGIRATATQPTMA